MRIFFLKTDFISQNIFCCVSFSICITASGLRIEYRCSDIIWEKENIRSLMISNYIFHVDPLAVVALAKSSFGS